MPREDEMQVGVFYSRPVITGGDEGSLPINLGGGEGNLLQIWALHWNIEAVFPGPNRQLFTGVALSSDPEHELAPLINFEDFQSHRALYGRALWIAGHDGIGDTTVSQESKAVPVYGLIRPRRQIMVWSILAGDAQGSMGIGLEVYYTPMGAPFTEREEVNRKFGKYRRS